MLKEKFLTYLSLEKKFSDNTIIGYRKDLEDLTSFVVSTESHDILLKIDSKILRNFIYSLSEKKLSEKSINRKISTIKSFYKFLCKTQHLDKNPSHQLESLKIKKQIILPFSEKEMNDLTDLENLNQENFTSKRNQLIIEIFYQTGIRRIELISLLEKNISFSQKTIKVFGKRNKERIIPISDNLIKLIKEYTTIKSRKKNNFSEYLFITNSSEKISEKTIYNIVNQNLSRVSTKSKRSPHVLRHTFATHLLNNEAELNSVKELLGHANLAATQVYTHQNIENLKKVFNQAHSRGQNKL